MSLCPDCGKPTTPPDEPCPRCARLRDHVCLSAGEARRLQRILEQDGIDAELTPVPGGIKITLSR